MNTDKMTKTGGRNENIDLYEIWRNLINSGWKVVRKSSRQNIFVQKSGAEEPNFGKI